MPRVLIAAATPARHRSMTAALAADPALTPVGAATTGQEAVLEAARRRPDIVVMDVDIRDPDGYEATRRIMSSAPCPIVLTTASPVAPDARGMAIEAGALAVVDFGPEPGARTANLQRSRLLETVTLMAQVPVITRRAGRRAAAEGLLGNVEERKVVGIAASAGGPDALATLLPAWPADLPAAVLLVQHIGRGFEEDLRSWLDDLTPLRVGIATAGEPLLPGQVLIAPGNAHLEVSGDGRVRLDGAPPVGGHRPSADRLFRSLAESYGPRAVGVILSGMGDDGVDGLVTLKRSGGYVIAQDEASCVVYGMPKEAVAAGVVDQVLAVRDIAATVEDLLRTVPAGRTPPSAAPTGPAGTSPGASRAGHRRSEQ